MTRELLYGYGETEFARGTDALLADIEAADPRSGAFTDTLGMPVMLAGDGWPVPESDCEM